MYAAVVYCLDCLPVIRQKFLFLLICFRPTASLLGHLAEAYKGHCCLALREHNSFTTIHTYRNTLLFTMSSSESGTDFDSTADMSLSPGNDRIDDPVGLSDPQNIAEMRKMLDAVNRLRATG